MVDGHADGGQLGQVGSLFSLSSFTWVPETQLSLLGLHGRWQVLYLLSHVAILNYLVCKDRESRFFFFF